MAYHHKFQITDLENLMPWELDVYTEMTADHLAEQAKAATQSPFLG